MSNKKDFYIFLDIDGVFNSFQWEYYVESRKLKEKGFSKEFCPENLSIFNKILKTLRENNFNPKIVLSSDWRKERMQEAIDFFNKYEIDYNRDYDKTGNAVLIDPRKMGLKRAAEIGNYLDANKLTLKDAFIIIDDYASEIKRYTNIPSFYFLQTSGEYGTGLDDNDFKRFKENNLPNIIKLLTEEENSL